MNKASNVKKSICIGLFLIASFLFNIVPHSYSLLMYSLLAISFGVVSYFSSAVTLLVCSAISYLFVLLSYCITVPGKEVFYEAFRVFLFVCPVSFFAGFAIKKKYDFHTLYTGSNLIFVLAIMLHIMKLVMIDKVSIVQSYIRIPFSLMMNTANMSDIPYLIAGQGIDSDVINYIVNSIVSSLPSVIIIFSMILTFVFIFVLKKIIRLFDSEQNFSSLVPFSHLKLKRRTVLTLFVLYLVSIFLSGTSGIVVGNIISILIVMCMGCGLSLIDFYFKKAIRNWVIRVFIYLTGFGIISLLFALLPFVNPLMLIALVGMIDASRDFRKIDKFDIKIIFK